MTSFASTPKSPRRLSGNAEGMVWMLASAACFTVFAVLIKFLSGTQHEMVMAFYRALIGTLVVSPFLLRKETWRVPRPGKMLMRALYSTLGFLTSFIAFAQLPLADAQSLSFTRALFVTLLAIVLLQEKVGMWRWSALGVGFAGVLLMVRPSASMDIASLSALASSFFFALAIVTVKDMTRDHHPMTLVVWSNALVALFALPFAIPFWSWPSWNDLMWLALMGASGVGAQTCYIRALAVGEASAVAPMDYVRLPLSVAAGWFLFQERPDALTLAGAAVLIISTLIITWREAKRGKPAAIVE
jgi:drug/metabolite transporter (DMT)-like permease